MKLNNLFKICTKCKIKKSIECFSVDRHKKSGRCSACKSCRNAQYSIWSKNNIEHKKVYDKRRSKLENVKLKNKINKNMERKRKPWLTSYYGAMDRCINKNNSHYHCYGGRGIKFLLTQLEIQKLWNRDKAWLLKQHGIDREDNDGNYEYGNCRFIEKSKNTRKGKKQ